MLRAWLPFVFINRREFSIDSGLVSIEIEALSQEPVLIRLKFFRELDLEENGKGTPFSSWSIDTCIWNDDFRGRKDRIWVKKVMSLPSNNDLLVEAEESLEDMDSLSIIEDSVIVAERTPSAKRSVVVLANFLEEPVLEGGVLVEP